MADTLPSAVTLDVGLIQNPATGVERWAVVEANMPWFSHSYAADPDAVLPVVLRAAGPRDRVAPRDIRFLRPHIDTRGGEAWNPGIRGELRLHSL